MNTVLLVEPRKMDILPKIMKNCHGILGDNWKYVFYCGKDLKVYWLPLMEPYVEIRELPVDNFYCSQEHSYFFKQKSLWESLYGEYVLSIQEDTWILNMEPYTIDYFIQLNKSYIGGNMNIKWRELQRESITFNSYNFNGGLSLRKRQDMIKIIESFPVTMLNKDTMWSPDVSRDYEDVYFTIGCKKLGLPLGDDEPSSHFAIHHLYKDAFFGIHQPDNNIIDILIKNHNDVFKEHPKLFKRR